MNRVLIPIGRHVSRGRSFGSLTTFGSVAEQTTLDLPRFRQIYFEAGVPVVLRGLFSDLPAVSKWFHRPEESSDTAVIDPRYFEPYGDTLVPLEITNDVRASRDRQEFARVNAPLSLFLRVSEPGALSDGRVYLAQCPVPDLPKELQKDVPVPELVKGAGKGDVYNSSIWLGQAPTYTPLHKDPNPNIFVQLAGSKVVRLMDPGSGFALYERVRMRIGGGGNPDMRGEEMMAGAEAQELEKEVWGATRCDSSIPAPTHDGSGVEATLGPGDGVFIPKGWWHSVRGVGSGMIGSVNWWFR